jgi:hypothetical protein
MDWTGRISDVRFLNVVEFGMPLKKQSRHRSSAANIPQLDLSAYRRARRVAVEGVPYEVRRAQAKGTTS